MRKQTALQRYEAEGYIFVRTPARFHAFADYEIRFATIEEDREFLLETFAKQIGQTVQWTLDMIASHAIETGLTPDELLWHHEESGWNGGLTVRERQREAAHKAWKTIRAKREAAEDAELEV